MNTTDRVRALEKRLVALEQRLLAVEHPTSAHDVEDRLMWIEQQLDPVTGSVLRDREA